MIEVKRAFARAELVEVVTASAARVRPPCPVYEACGGCQLQHLSYKAQLQLKTARVHDSLERIGKFNGIDVRPTIGMREPWRYRNRAQIPFGEQDGGLVAGFYARGTHRMVDMDACLLQHETSDEVVQTVKRIARDLGISGYDKRQHRGVLRHVVTKVGVHTGELMIVLVTKGSQLPRKKLFIHALREQFPQLVSLVQNVNSKRTSVVLGTENRTLWGRETITDTIGGIRFSISPHSFFQVNSQQTEVLYREVLRAAALTGKETVVDAYCGIGTISLFLAQHARQVLAMDIVDAAIADAKRNARLNGIANVQFAVGKAEELMPRWYAQGVRPEVVVVDPPRKGCDERLLTAIADMGPARVIYVSCQPSTLARDLRFLADRGYTVQEVQPVDMFPQTAHIETVATLEGTS